MSLGRAVRTVGGFTILSRLLGLVREILIASLLGAGPLADAFFMAFKLPNFFRRLFGEGAFNAAFVPLFSGQLATQGATAAFQTAQHIFTLLWSMLILLVFSVEAFCEPLVAFLAPGFQETPDRFQSAVQCVAITFPYIFFISLSAMGGGILNSFHRFGAAAGAPILLNISMILSLIIPLPFCMNQACRLSWGVFFAGALQLLLMGYSCARIGFIPTLTWPRLTPEVRHFFKRLIPGLLGAGALQVNAFIGLILASLLPLGSVSYLFYADRLVQLPLSVIGIATSTALLPTLSQYLKQGNQKKAEEFQRKALFLALGLSVPAMIGLLLLDIPILRLLFQRGAFQEPQLHGTALALEAMAWGLPAYVSAKIFSTIFFAYGDTKTPLSLSLISVVSDIGLCLLLLKPFQHQGIAMATAGSSWINSLGLLYLLQKRSLLSLDVSYGVFSFKLLLSSGIMGLFLWGGQEITYGWIREDLSLLSQFMRLSATMIFGLLGGGIAAYGLGLFRYFLKERKQS